MKMISSKSEDPCDCFQYFTELVLLPDLTGLQHWSHKSIVNYSGITVLCLKPKPFGHLYIGIFIGLSSEHILCSVATPKKFWNTMFHI